MTDVPTQWTPYNVTGDVGGVIRGNYCVINPLTPTSVRGTVSNGNLTVTSAANNFFAPATAFVNSGKWYAEYTISSGANAIVGIMPSTCNPRSSSYFANGAGDGTGINDNNAGAGGAFRIFNYANNGSVDTLTGQTYASGDVIGIAMDLDSGILNFYRNGSIITTGRSNNNAVSYTLSSVSPYWAFACGNDATYTINLNFGQYAFTYAPPSGYKSLCTTNLPTPTIQQGNLYMDATLYTGTGAALSVTNTAGFKPDLVWNKARSFGGNNMLTDSVRGTNSQLLSDDTGAQSSLTTAVTAFNSNGFSLGSLGTVNNSGSTFVGWQWQAGQGTTSSNTSGSITSTVSVNPTAGFSVVTYSGASTTSTVGHGLGVAPSMVIVKSRNTSGQDWQVYHSALGQNQIIQLNSTAAAQTYSNYWYNGMTSSVFGVNNYSGVNASGTNYVAYCWSEVAGFSKFGSFVANGSADGPFIYTGFRPKLIIIKRSSNAGAPWSMVDTSRNPYNAANLELDANSSDAEFTAGNGMDIVSNGFKLRDSAYFNSNSGDTFIYMAFAEYPFKSALAR